MLVQHDYSPFIPILLLTGTKENEHMTNVNFTLVTEFILLGLTDSAELKVALFVLFLLIYTISLVGNLGMLFLIQITPKLQTPMYHFLSSLSFVDACYLSVFAPKMLLNFFVEQGTISFSACIMQYFLSCHFLPLRASCWLQWRMTTIWPL